MELQEIINRLNEPRLRLFLQTLQNDLTTKGIIEYMFAKNTETVIDAINAKEYLEIPFDDDVPLMLNIVPSMQIISINSAIQFSLNEYRLNKLVMHEFNIAITDVANNSVFNRLNNYQLGEFTYKCQTVSTTDLDSLKDTAIEIRQNTKTNSEFADELLKALDNFGTNKNVYNVSIGQDKYNIALLKHTAKTSYGPLPKPTYEKVRLDVTQDNFTKQLKSLPYNLEKYNQLDQKDFSHLHNELSTLINQRQQEIENMENGETNLEKTKTFIN